MTLEDILGLSPTQDLLDWQSKVKGKTVMVTGAGGFIASELCKALVTAGPRLLILVENSEYALYRVVSSLSCPVVPMLCSYGDQEVPRAIELYKPSLVIHAGAYKHVPMVERNMIRGVQNNVLEFVPLAKAVARTGAELLVVSSDKAVNPTNVMGATKKLVEDVALAYVEDARCVRFGNVMWSSGSVLPLFEEQLRTRKYVTLTHHEATRYFMTCGQAVSLMLQSIALPSAGIYALDMGKPVSIRTLIENLARSMDISEYRLIITGLRPGEKLHEELTLGEGLLPTEHPQIMRAQEPKRTKEGLHQDLVRMARAAGGQDASDMRRILQEVVRGYVPACGIVDDLWLEQFVNRGRSGLEDCFAPTVPA
jgi:FlaA1/EpsC-like NDP-sugar epimerase